MDELSLAEFDALRETIRTRGTLRILLFWLTIAVWATLALLILATAAVPAAALFSLMALAAGFEAVHAIHVNVERIGRYLQVCFEETRSRAGWETASMAFGQRFPAAGSDPLFSGVFLAAAALNFVPVLLAGVQVELTTLGVVHALAMTRIALARRAGQRLRAADLERFRTIAANPRTAARPGQPED
jgi:hypothetical protein